MKDPEQGRAFVLPEDGACDLVRAIACIRNRERDAETDLPVAEVGLEEDDPRFFGVAVADAAAFARLDRLGPFVELRAVVEHPAFVMMKYLPAVVVHVHAGGQPDLVLTGETGGSLRPVPRPGERGQEKADQQGNDSDNDEKLDQGEAGPPVGTVTRIRALHEAFRDAAATSARINTRFARGWIPGDRLGAGNPRPGPCLRAIEILPGHQGMIKTV